MALKNLDAADIQALLSASRQKGQYDTALKAFVESDSPGDQVDLEAGEFSGKKPNTIKTGFESAIKREGAPEAAQHVRVIVSDEQVYLIRTDMVG